MPLYSQVTYTGNGSTTAYAIPFAFIDSTHVKAFINGTITSAFTISTSTLTFTTAPANGATIRIERQTPIDARLVDFSDGSVLTEADLDRSANQNFFVAQEITDDQANNIALDTDDKYNANSKVIKNLANPVNANDAVNKTYLENTWLSTADKASLVTLTTNIANVNAVNSALTNVNAVGSDLLEATSEINTVAVDITNVNNVGNNIANVNTVAGISANITTLAGTAGLATLASNAGNIATVASQVTPTNNIATVAGANANITTVAGAVANVNAVGGSIANVNTVAGANANITTVATANTNIGTVATNIANVNTVAGANANLSTVVTNIANINTVAGNNANITTVAGANANITTVAGISGAISTVASNSANISTIATDIAKVITTANDLNEATSEIEVVANAIANVDLVGNSISNVNTVATNIANVNSVNSNSTNINSVAGNSTNINSVASNSANINSVAGSIANVNTVGSNIGTVNDFGQRYRVSATAPTTSLDLGDLYFDTTSNTMKVYSSGGFINAGSSVNGTANRFRYTATASQTTFTGADANGNTLAYDAGFLDVYLNGIKLVNTLDFTASSGTSIVLTTGATVSDILEVIAYGTFQLANFSIADANDVPALGTVGQVLKVNSGATALEYGTITNAILPAPTLIVQGDGSSTDGAIQLNCSQNSHGVKIKSPAHASSQNYTLILPTSVGSAGQVLASDGNNTNQLSWITASETKPTITSISPSTVGNTATNVVITGTNFEITPNVEIINSNGGIQYPNTIVRNSSTQLTINVTIATDANYFIRVENPNGLAVRSTTALLTVSDAPVFSTSAGSLGSFSLGASISTSVLATSDSAVTYSIFSGALPSGLSLNSSTGAITGTDSSGVTAETVFNFTIRATDLEAQTVDRAFSITITVGINNGVQFN